MRTATYGNRELRRIYPDCEIHRAFLVLYRNPSTRSRFLRTMKILTIEDNLADVDIVLSPIVPHLTLMFHRANW